MAKKVIRKKFLRIKFINHKIKAKKITKRIDADGGKTKFFSSCKNINTRIRYIENNNIENKVKENTATDNNSFKYSCTKRLTDNASNNNKKEIDGNNRRDGLIDDYDSLSKHNSILYKKKVKPKKIQKKEIFEKSENNRSQVKNENKEKELESIKSVNKTTNIEFNNDINKIFKNAPKDRISNPNNKFNGKEKHAQNDLFFKDETEINHMKYDKYESFEENYLSDEISSENKCIKNLTDHQNQKEKEKIAESIKHISKKRVSIEKIQKLFDNGDYAQLREYSFPYMKFSEFCYKIYSIDVKKFRAIYFYCPICEEKLKHFSIAYHIFQFHFNEKEKYINANEIAKGCANLMTKEYTKIKNSLQLFSELAILYNSTETRGANEWGYKAKEMINNIITMDIENEYFNRNLNEANEQLNAKLPLNKDKKKKSRNIINNKSINI